MTKTTIPVAAYTRYSTAKQDRSSASGQLKNIRAFAAAHDYTIVAEFKDPERSGLDERRPEYLQMLAAAERGAFAGIIVDHTDRLSRVAGGLPRLVEELGFRRQFILDTKGFDSRHQTAQLMAGIYGGLDRLELKKIAERTHRGLRAAQRRIQRGRQALRLHVLRRRPERRENPLDPND
jgi:DNA invertase Pin-like site-specific DNA recombinase